MRRARAELAGGCLEHIESDEDPRRGDDRPRRRGVYGMPSGVWLARLAIHPAPAQPTLRRWSYRSDNETDTQFRRPRDYSIKFVLADHGPQAAQENSLLGALAVLC